MIMGKSSNGKTNSRKGSVKPASEPVSLTGASTEELLRELLVRLGEDPEREGLLRHAFFRDGDYLDQVLWSILAEDWRRRQQDTLAWRSSVVH